MMQMVEQKNPRPRPIKLERTYAARINFQHRMSKMTLQLNFLWEAYKPAYWYWELVETSRRIILTAVFSVCSTGSSKQNVLSIFLAFVFIKTYGYFQPYTERSDYRMAEIGQTDLSDISRDYCDRTRAHE